MVALSLQKIQQRMQDIKGWGLEGGGLEKEWMFDDFNTARTFVMKVADLASAQNHHPTIFWDYNKVRLILTTHDERGITEKDIQLAGMIDKL
jgi:4a-hydroxytetrahydrobiopterin dehydratase